MVHFFKCINCNQIEMSLRTHRLTSFYLLVVYTSLEVVVPSEFCCGFLFTGFGLERGGVHTLNAKQSRRTSALNWKLLSQRMTSNYRSGGYEKPDEIVEIEGV